MCHSSIYKQHIICLTDLQKDAEQFSLSEIWHLTLNE